MEISGKKVFSLILITVAFILANSTVQAPFAIGGSSSFLTILSEPPGSLDRSVADIRSEVMDFADRKGVRGKVPPVLVNVYAQSSVKNVIESTESYKQAAEEVGYEGVVVFYFKGDTILFHSFSDEIPESAMKQIIAQAEQEMGSLSDSEVLERLGKRIVAEIADFEEGEACKEICGSGLSCQETFSGADKEKACCPEGQRWDGKSCQIGKIKTGKSEGERGSECEGSLDCDEYLACRPTFPEVSYEKACCGIYEMWNGTDCRESDLREKCFVGSCRDDKDLNCNPAFSNAEKNRACCPGGKMWDPNKEKCRYAEKKERCEKDMNCDIAPLLDYMLIGELSCNPAFSDSENKRVCCPGDTMYDPDSDSCKEAGKGDRCEKDANCGQNTFEQERNCNPTTADFRSYDKACCPGDELWNGSQCLEMENKKVKGFRPLEDCEKGPFDRFTCNAFEPTYNKYLDVCHPSIKSKLRKWILSDSYLKARVSEGYYDSTVRETWEKSYEFFDSKYCPPACTGNSKPVSGLISGEVSCGMCNHWSAVGTSLIRTLGVPKDRVYSVGYWAPYKGGHAATAYKSDQGNWWILDYTCCKRLVKAENWDSCRGCSCSEGKTADNDYYSGKWKPNMFGGICHVD